MTENSNATQSAFIQMNGGLCFIGTHIISPVPEGPARTISVPNGLTEARVFFLTLGFLDKCVVTPWHQRLVLFQSRHVLIEISV